MLPVDVDAILRAHEAHSIAFQYQRDCYALSLLAHVIGGGRPISVLRAGPFARLLEKPIVKRALAHAGSRMLTPKCLEKALPTVREDFPVTLARWGGKPPEWSRGYYQTSRPGESLVLQLNFPQSHDRAYRKLLRPGAEHPFVPSLHPARSQEPFTLAWARLDFDAQAGEVLVEEVQCDWVKLAEAYGEAGESWLSKGLPNDLCFADLEASALSMLSYLERVLRPYARIWEECVLALALEFSYSSLGVRKVFFHTHEGGRIMKRLCSCCPSPRSLYTRLPERFCFVRTRVPPRMFEGDRRLDEHEVEWFSLELV